MTLTFDLNIFACFHFFSKSKILTSFTLFFEKSVILLPFLKNETNGVKHEVTFK